MEENRDDIRYIYIFNYNCGSNVVVCDYLFITISGKKPQRQRKLEVMNGFNCDDIRRTLSTGTALLDVRTTNELSHTSLPEAKDVTSMGGLSH